MCQTAADCLYLARHVGLRSGIPIEAPALTINRLCGSGFETLVQASKSILLGESQICVAGGAENMSMAPYAVLGLDHLSNYILNNDLVADFEFRFSSAI